MYGHELVLRSIRSRAIKCQEKLVQCAILDPKFEHLRPKTENTKKLVIYW